MLRQRSATSLAGSLAILLLIAASTTFLYKTANIMKSGDRSDLKIFIANAHNYINTGMLYQRDDNPAAWQPSGGVYKFPPAYQLLIVPFLKAGMSDDALITATAIALAMVYLVSIAFLISLCVSDIRQLWSPPVLSLMAGLLLFTPFFSAFKELAAEILIFGLLTAMLFALSKNKCIIFGILLAIAVHIKVYPVLIVLYLIAIRSWVALASFIATAFVILAVCVSYFGLAENLYYLTTVLPILGSEAPYPHFQNLSLEIWLENHQLITHASGSIQNVIRLVMLGVFIVITLSATIKQEKKRALAFGIFCAGLLVWLTNYWPQYQLMLLIPFVLLSREALAQRARWQYILLLVIALSLLTTQTGLYQLLKYQVDMGMINEPAMSLYGSTHTASEVLFEFSLIGLCYYWLLQLNVFLPHILLLASIMALYQDSYFPSRHLSGDLSR